MDDDDVIFFLSCCLAHCIQCSIEMGLFRFNWDSYYYCEMDESDGSKKNIFFVDKGRNEAKKAHSTEEKIT